MTIIGEPRSNSAQQQKMMDFVTVKKTERRSQWLNPQEPFSVVLDMVQVGVLPRPVLSHSAVDNVVSHRALSVSNINAVPVSESLSNRSSSINSNRAEGRLSAVMLGNSSTTIVTTTPPAVSALTKVSSVRIVPTPTPTPTPSVTGNSSSENGSTKMFRGPSQRDAL